MNNISITSPPVQPGMQHITTTPNLSNRFMLGTMIRSITEFEISFMHTLTHEACHAAIALSLGQIISQVWLNPPGRNQRGGIWHAGIQDPSLDNARVALAGVVYEWMVSGCLKNADSEQDVLDAWASLKYDRSNFTPRERTREERTFLFKRIFHEVAERLIRFETEINQLADEFAKRLLHPDRQSRKKKRHLFNLDWNDRMKRRCPALRY